VPMIDVSELIKDYGDTRAVAGVSFKAQAGEIFGLLGPNGAGKTTTLGCMSGLLKPTSGRVSIQGHDVVTEGRAAKRALGVVPQEIALYEEISVRENLVYWGGAFGLRGPDLKQRIDGVLDLIQLTDRAKDAVKKLSGGMKRRLNFACGIVHSPQVLLLDEPTVGVDPQSRVKLLDLVRHQAQEGRCVVYTTHYMEEAEHLCDRLGIIDHGQLIAQGTLTELRAMSGEQDLIRLTGKFPEINLPEALSSLGPVVVHDQSEEQLLFSVRGAAQHLPAVLGVVSSAGAEIRETTVTQPSLENLFIKLTGRELRE
jgi:ABC-2 type transport system ATP-binding protein